MKKVVPLKPKKKDEDIDLRTMVGKMPDHLRSSLKKMFARAKAENKDLKQIFDEELAKIAKAKPDNIKKK